MLEGAAGCSRSHEGATDAAQPIDGGPEPRDASTIDIDRDAPRPARDAAADAFTPADAGLDAPAPIDATVDGSDPRLCEAGWPTTKGVFTVEVDGLSWTCHARNDRENPDLSCCVVTGE